MKVLEDLVAPAVVADLVSRLISFLVTRCVKQTCRVGMARRLELLALKIHAVVDEAEQRDLASNRRLLLWLNKLMEGMYRAYYMLDVTTHHRVDHDGCALVRSSWSFPLSRLTGPAKRLCTVAAGTTVGHDDGVDQLSVVLARLEDATEDMKEFILVLACCPRIQRRPISNFFSEDKFMFGRLVEREQIISFLLKPGSNLDILPIVGGPEVGKGTIVKRVCSDERVRDHFSFILYSYGSLLEEHCVEDMLGTLRRGGHALHESSISGHGRHLLVIKNTYEVVISEAVWVALCASLRSTAPGSKIIVISENDGIADLGTVVAMRVKPLPQKEYWYFFGSLAFGGNDPEERPDLAVLGRKIAAALSRSFHASLRVDDDHFSKICVAKIALETLPVPLRLRSACKTGVASELPAMTIQELLHSAGVPHQEEIRIMLWECADMPNYRYTVVCEKVEKRPSAPIERKRWARQQQIDQ